MKPKQAIQKKFEVQDKDKTMTVRIGGLGSTGFDKQNRNIYIVGPEGAGKADLARELAGRLEMEFADPGAAAQDPASKPGRVVPVPPDMVRDPEAAQTLKAGGRVFYLMANAGLIADRLGLDHSKRPEILEALMAEEPAYLTIADHIIRADSPVEVMADKAVEALSI